MVLLNQAIQRYPSSETMQQIHIPEGQAPAIRHYSTLPRKEPKLHAAQKHRLAEQNRRNRISGQYATLRAILPTLSKTDKTKFKKAFVLYEAIRRVKELKKVALEVRERGMIPSATDRLSLEQCEDGVEGTILKAVISCEDRQEILAELGKALKTVKMKVVRAEMVTVGGRNKFALWMKGPKEGPFVGLKRALEAAIRNPSWVARKPTSDWLNRSANNYAS